MEMRGLWDEGYHGVSVPGIQVIDKYSVIRLFYAFLNARPASCSAPQLLLRTLRFVWNSLSRESVLVEPNGSTPITTLPTDFFT